MRFAVATAGLVAALALAAPAAAAPELLTISDKFDQPVHATSPAADTRVFVVEKPGTVRIVKDGQLLAEPFLDIAASVEDSGEQGLLSIAFPPDYATTGLFYVYFTKNDGNNVIAEFQRRPGNADQADAATRRDVLALAHPTFANHDGGQLQFGPDGLLYAATGDGGSGNDPTGNAQNLDSHLGKLLRLDPRLSAGAQYSVPAGNPFGAAGGTRALVWSWGLRNPWRFSFDRANRDLWIGDVGQDAWEEIDRAPAGSDGTPGGRSHNFGWRCFEGTHQNTAITPRCDPPDDTPPVHEYPNPSAGQSVVGGYVVRDAAVPSLAGRYVFGDTYAPELRSLDAAAPQNGAVATGMSVAALSSFGEDACGRVLVTSLDGALYRVREAGAADPPCVPPPPGSGPTPPGGPAPPAGGGDDRRPPLLSVALGSVRGLVATGRLRPRVGCDEPCVVRAGTSVADIRRRSSGRALAGPDKQRFMTVRLSTAQRRVLSRALRRRPSVTLKVTFTATDAGGNRSTVLKRARLRAVRSR